MKLCLICGEIFAWGKYGGFGRATRSLGRELVKCGVEVVAVVPRRGDQKAVEKLDGMTVFSFPKWNMLEAARLYRACNADIYHSQEPSFGTWLAMKASPQKKHLVTFRDTRDQEDWNIEINQPSRNKFSACLNRIYEDNVLVHQAVRQADALFCASYGVGAKAHRVYQLPSIPPMLPTPVLIPPAAIKAAKPTVCFVGRMARRKRPEQFFMLAEKFPDVRFIGIGDSRDPAWFNQVMERYKGLPNLENRGFVDQFNSRDVFNTYSESWILMNPATREGLPNTYLEALAHQCAVLSRTDPDGLASRFGYHAATDDFETGLRFLLQGDEWRRRGLAGRNYIAGHYEQNHAVNLHMDIYKKVLLDPAMRSK